jgi:hypothetical protein
MIKHTVYCLKGKVSVMKFKALTYPSVKIA